ncbi:MAG TPA: hypothetical protein VL547_18055 [Dinghuibacter sp.]|uniref:glucuronyl hydrolase n=1 Tax=Dinghuibacter sp. TaxID=2024697 RepID=UPI002B8CEE1E|nr:glucuronyl hydrolase [Dinghuibacter sp.]HTJ13949.1 hypothetical protein [Dinghuibacter sp.]
MKHLLIVLLIPMAATAQFHPDPSLLRTIDTNLRLADTQYRYLAAHTPGDVFPRTFDPKTGAWTTSGPGWWTSGFAPATMLRLYSANHDTALYREALRRMRLLENEQYDRSTHDLGFMMFCPFGEAYRMTGSTAYADILMNSARSLGTRFSPITGCIRSWDFAPWRYPVIIDNMMNLELLCWASHHSGDTSFLHIAVTHASTTMRQHYRPDYSCYHVVEYDTATGAVIDRKTAQGYSDSSSWARGQAWGLYGYTMMYRWTHDRRYLSQAIHIADFILAHIPADRVPYWDYNDPRIPDTYRDASAAAVMASALIELAGYAPPLPGWKYIKAAETALRTLSSPAYRAPAGTNGGYLLMHSVGNLPVKAEIDVPLTYADYYFVEAMLRYRAL